MLMLKAKAEPGETVLIHNGCSGIGLACISVASNYGCTVFTTVANLDQKMFLKKMFPNVSFTFYTLFKLM